MRLTQRTSLVLLTAGLAAAAWPGNAQPVGDPIQVARAALKADRKATVAETLQLTPEEGKAFWPLYEQYSAALQKPGDALLKLTREYGQLYPNVPDDRARAMLKELADLEMNRVETRSSYLRKIEKVMSPVKTLRFAQVEARLDLALRLAIAASIPLVPIEGRLTGEASAAAVSAEGVPGGAVVLTYELKARVAAIDPARRKITVVDAAGIKKTVKAGPEIVNFDQIRVGDQLKITATEELVASVAGAGESPGDGGAQLVALAPEGTKPGAFMAETTLVTAQVAAIDAAHHRATLQFEDGSRRTISVRPDVDLAKRKVGESVVIRMTESLAIKITKL